MILVCKEIVIKSRGLFIEKNSILVERDGGFKDDSDLEKEEI